MIEKYPIDTTQVLVISSEQEICQLLFRELTTAGYAVRVYDDDPECFDPSEVDTPTIIISDWKFREKSEHLQIWEKIKGNASAAPLFCLILAAKKNFSEYEFALTQGIDDLLSLPIDLEELRARVSAGKRILQLKQALSKQQQLLETELSEAEAYVRSLLPNDLTDEIPITARFVPSRLLGGDSYDFYWLDPDYLAIYLLDVSGHGLGSALLSTSVLNVLRSQSLPNVNFYRPEKVLNALNETFQMNDQNEKYFTIWYGVYNRANRQLLYASAGHPPAVLVTSHGDRSQTTKCLKTTGLPVGMLPEIKYQWQRCYIPPMSRLYVFSDGIYEIRQTDSTLMGLDDFVEILSQHLPELTIDDILSQVNERNQSQTFLDDLSILEVCLD